MRQLSFFPLPAPRERTHRPPARPAPTHPPIRLADLREGEERRITCAVSFYVASGEPHVAAYAGAILTKTNGAPLITLTSAHLVGLHAVREIAEQPPATAEEYRQLYAAVARHHSTAKYPSFEEE
jgi:hypothetical protein